MITNEKTEQTISVVEGQIFKLIENCNKDGIDYRESKEYSYLVGFLTALEFSQGQIDGSFVGNEIFKKHLAYKV